MEVSPDGSDGQDSVAPAGVTPRPSTLGTATGHGIGTESELGERFAVGRCLNRLAPPDKAAGGRLLTGCDPAAAERAGSNPTLRSHHGDEARVACYRRGRRRGQQIVAVQYRFFIGNPGLFWQTETVIHDGLALPRYPSPLTSPRFIRDPHREIL